MATTKKYVVLADIESIRVPFATFNAALEELATFGEVAVCKFYGYSAKRTKDYGEFIQENSYDALSTLPKKRKGRASSTFARSSMLPGSPSIPMWTGSSSSTARATSLRSSLI